MKVLKESREQLPIDFITSFVSKSWEEVGNIKASINGINGNFKDTKKVEEILQNLVDAYLITIGQLEMQLDNKKYLDMPDEKTLQESLNDKEDDVETSIKLDNFEVEVEEKDDSLAIEISPKNDEKEELDDEDVDESEDEKKEKSSDFELIDFDEPDVSNTEESAYQQWMNYRKSV